MSNSVIDEYLTTGLGKVPPQSVDIEEAVLALLIEETPIIHEVVSIIQTADVFYKDVHRVIYDAMLVMYQNQQPIDLLTITHHLEKNGKLDYVGGRYYLTELTTRANIGIHIERHCRVLVEKYFLRELISAGAYMSREGYENSADPFELIEHTYNKLNTMVGIMIGGGQASMAQLAKETKEYIDKIRDTPGFITGIDTGFRDLNTYTAGWQSPDLIIIAGRPGMGKSALMIELAKRNANKGTKIAIFSLEMTRRQLMMRIISGDSEVALERMIRGQTTADEKTWIDEVDLSKVVDNMEIMDQSSVSIMHLRSMAHRIKQEQGLDLLFVDFLQIMDGEGDSREQEISFISRNLKGLAKDLDIPIIALSQLSRAVEMRGGTKKPQLSDLRESGSIEQDADIVIFLYRPEYYGIKVDEAEKSTAGVAELIVAKNRQGRLGTITLEFVGKYTKFNDGSEGGVQEGEEDDLPF